MKFIFGFVTAMALSALVAALLIYGGRYNVSALEPHHPIMAWVLHTTMETSVRHHAEAIVPPANLPARASQGFQDFDEMCVQCHGAPGKERGEVGQGLRPQPPSLVDAAQRWRPSEIFWIVKNGVHMTGMPAFGPTHDDQRIWDIIAFVGSLKGVTPERYEQMRSSMSNAAHENQDHPDEQHDHSEQHHH